MSLATRRALVGVVALVAALVTTTGVLPAVPWVPKPPAAHAATGDGVDLLPLRLVHSDGAELAWTRYTGPSGAAFDRYEVHRSTTSGFTPTASTLLTTIRDQGTTSWRDHTAAAGKTFYYKVVANTTPSADLLVTTPAAGQASLTLQTGAGDVAAGFVAHDTISPATCSADANFGGRAYLRIGTSASGWVHRPTLSFDLRDIPTTATVTAATLRLVYPATSLNPGAIGVYRVTRPWTEGSETGTCNGTGDTWNESQHGISWTKAGGDYDATADATIASKSRTAAGADSVSLLALVREWVSGTSPNDGVLLKPTTETVGTTDAYSDWRSNEYATTTDRPKLTVTYTDGSAPRAPRAAVAAPGDGTTIRGTAVRFAASVGDDRRVDKVEFLVDGVVAATDTAAPWETTLDLTTRTNGTHTLSVRATDDAGNVTTSVVANVVVDNTAAPTASITSPAAGATVSGTVSVGASATDDTGVKSVALVVDGTQVGAADTTSPYSLSWNTLDQLARTWNAAHTLQVRVVDASGNATLSASRSVTVANSPGSEFDASFVLNDPTTTSDDVFPDVMTETPDNGTTTVQDPYSGGTDSSGYSTGSSGKSITSSPYIGTQLTAQTTTTKSSTTSAKTSATSTQTQTATATLTTASPCPDGDYCPTVTITNESPVAWKGGDLSVWYMWYAPNGAVLSEGPAVDKFPQTFQTGATKSFPLTIIPPTLPPGAELGDYRLRVDLYDTANGTWFSGRGNAPIDNPVLLVKSLDDKLGLERFWQYEGDDLGAGMTTLTNVANGNMLLRWTPWADPGRGLSTVLDLTYNSLEDHSRSPIGENFSLGLSGLSRLGQPIDIHPNKADEISGHANKYVDVVDSDGTVHRFTGNADGSWTEPPGVNLYLRSVGGTDPNRQWALTRPDKVTFYYDADGFPTSVEDRNGNDLVFTEEVTAPGEDPGGPKKRITKVTDAGGSSFSIDYWSKDEEKRAHVRGKIQRITDHAGHGIDFDYYDDGNLLRIRQEGGVDASGDYLPDRSFVFTYTTPNGDAPAISDPALRVNPDPHTMAESTRIYSVRDPRGAESRFTYYTSTDSPKLRWKLKTRTDRAGDVTSFDYDYVNQVTTVKAPLSRNTSFTYDADGKVTRLVNPLGEATTVAWTSDFKVSRVTEPTGKSASYTYNQNGYPLTETNQLNQTTKLTYLDSAVDGLDASRHLSLLSTKTNPNGVATVSPTTDYMWTYTYDSAGNPDKVIDPTGATRDYLYNLAGSANPGTIATAKDANGNVTTFVAYDKSGQPSDVLDAGGNHTKIGYDADGEQTWVQDPLHAGDSGADTRSYRSYSDYDSFHRLGRQSAPKSTASDRGNLLWSSVDFDANDNSLRQVDPHFAGADGGDDEHAPASTGSYDAMDRETVLANSDTSVDPLGERTAFSYDAAGRVTRRTKPKGVLSATADDYSTGYVYDALDRVVRQTDYGTGTTDTRVANLCYDLAGDVRSVTSPRSGLATVTCPVAASLAYTTRYDYDAAHRMVTQTDPLGHAKRTTYDADGNITVKDTDIDTSTTPARSSHEVDGYDERDLRTSSAVTLGGGTGRTVTTRYEYDPNGNQKRVVSPRGVDAAGPGATTFSDYVTTYDYDALNRLNRITLPRDGQDVDSAGQPETQYVHRAYDADGHLTMTTLPVTTAAAGSVTAKAKTTMTYFDTGWIRTSADPSNPELHYDYAAQGWQIERTPETSRSSNAGLDTSKRMTWDYFSDGKLKERKDQGGQPSTYTYDADNNLLKALDASGVTDPGETAVQTESSYTAFDQVAKVRHKKSTATTWTFTDYTYDPNGNVTTRDENGEESTATPPVQTKAPDRHDLSYDQADWLVDQLDLGTDSTCADDQHVVTTYWATGWEKKRDISRGGSSCTADPSTWAHKQTTTWDYFDNGKLSDLVTKADRSGSLVTTESHDVSYIDEKNNYANNNRTTDVFFQEHTSGGTAACGSAANPCTEKIFYDARDKVVKHQRHDTVVDTYTLDQPSHLDDPTLRPGEVTTENKDGVSTTRDYQGSQLTSMTTGGATGKFWYDTLGNLDCVTTGATGCGSGGLVTDFAYDYLNRLATSRGFDGTGTQTSKTSYTYDALDRTDKEVEDHPGTGTDRTTTFTHQGLSDLVTQEKQSGGTNPMTKSFSYDAYGHRLAMTTTDSAGAKNTYSYTYDVHGSVSQLVTDAGAVKASYGYDTYGNTDASMSSGDSATDPLNPYRYSGKRLDSGMSTFTGGAGYDMGARRYGSDLTRFMQQDMYSSSLGDLGLSLDPLTQNRYSLAGGNPISFVETDGHMMIADGGGGASTTPNPKTSSSTSTSSGGTEGGGGESSPNYWWTPYTVPHAGIDWAGARLDKAGEDAIDFGRIREGLFRLRGQTPSASALGRLPVIRSARTSWYNLRGAATAAKGRFVGGALKVGGKALGAVGIGLAAYEGFQTQAERDAGRTDLSSGERTARNITSGVIVGVGAGLGAAAGAALCGPLCAMAGGYAGQVLGQYAAQGVMHVIDNTDWGAIGDGISDAASSVGDAVGDAASSVGDAVSDIGDALNPFG